MQVKNKVVVITGGASGLGLATARHLVEQKGSRVAIFDTNVDAGLAVAEELGESRALFVPTDVTSEESVREAIVATMAKFGAIHVCINCAGMAAPFKILTRNGTATPLARFA